MGDNDYNSSNKDNSDNIYPSEDDNNYNSNNMPHKRMLGAIPSPFKQPATAKKKVDDVSDIKPRPFAHKLCNVIRVVYYTKVTITINGFVDPSTYKIDIVSKGSALLFCWASLTSCQSTTSSCQSQRERS